CTAVCAMPNTDPVTDNQAAVGFIVRQAARAGLTRVYPIGAISVGQKGEQLSEFGEMVGAGAVAVSDDGKPVASSHMMRTALEYAQTLRIHVADHGEQPTLGAAGARAAATPHPHTPAQRAREGSDPQAKMSPPLREAADVAALRAALKDGVIDCIASDHAPHAYDAKEAAFDDAPFGVAGLET